MTRNITHPVIGYKKYQVIADPFATLLIYLNGSDGMDKAGGIAKGKVFFGKPILLDIKGYKFPLIATKDGKYVRKNEVAVYSGGKPVGMREFSGAEGASSERGPSHIKPLPYITSSAGTLWGLYHAYKTDSSFWGYVGFALLGGISGGVVGGLIAAFAYTPTAHTAEDFSGANGRRATGYVSKRVNVCRSIECCKKNPEAQTSGGYPCSIVLN